MVELPSGYYYSGGYDMNAKKITVLMMEPGKHPKVTTLKDDLDTLQKADSIGADCQGLIEFVSLGNGDCIMCNEEGNGMAAKGTARAVPRRHTGGTDLHERSLQPQACPRMP